MKSVIDVDEYILSAPKEFQKKLQELRLTIKSVVPHCQERISYDMPSYYCKGTLIYFALWKKHIGLYGLTTAVLEQFKSELEGYVMPKGTIQLPLSERLPFDLIKKLVKAQAKINDGVEVK